ncbi:MAG: DNA translocase FtsK 4TM domain-containing protein [Muribaculaceae bacterium]
MEEFDINPDRYQNTQRRTRASRRSESRGYTGINEEEQETVSTRTSSQDEPAKRRRRPAVTEEQPVEKTGEKAEVRTTRKHKEYNRPINDRRQNNETDYNDNGDSRGNGLPGLLKDRRVHIFFGSFLLIIGALMAITLFSYLRTAAADQSHVINQTVEEMSKQGSTSNAGGSFGAWFTHAVFSDALGVGSFIVAIYLIMVGGFLIAAKKFNFWALTFKSLLLAVTLSIVTGLVTYTADSEVVWGGTHGHGFNKFLIGHTGYIGAVAVSILLLVAVFATFYYPICSFGHKCKSVADKIQVRRAAAARPLTDDTTEYEPQPRSESRAAGPEPVKTAVSEGPIPSDNEPRPSQSSGSTQDTKQTSAPDDNTAFSFDDEPAPAESGFQVTLTQLDSDQADTTEEDSEKKPVSTVRKDHRDGMYFFKQPTIELLDDIRQENVIDEEEQERNRQNILDTLAQFRIGIKDIKATIGPTVTLYELYPEEGVRPQDIKRLEENLAMGLKSKNVRVITITENGTVGIEVPNANPQTVSMRSVLDSNKFRTTNKPLPVALGATIQNEIFMTNIAKMPHLLVAGATGQGKSVGLNAIITSLLFKKHPSELKFVLIDPKMVEFSMYSKLINHYLAKLPDDDDDAIVTDMNKVLAVLNSLCIEMDNRYDLIRKAGEREIEGYNAKFENGKLDEIEGHKYLPYLVLVIDEFADLIMTGGKEIESPITRIAQKGRAAGMHMIIATQRPSRQVLTGLIKSNCPARIAFRVSQRIDSGIILDEQGADTLIGRGDMIYKNGDEHERVQCAFISNREVERVVDFISQQASLGQPYLLPDPDSKPGAGSGSFGGTTGTRASGGMERDAMFDEIARAVVLEGKGSTSWIQRNFGLGYNRAGKLMDQMHAAGIVGPENGSKPRSILVDMDTLERILSQK